MTTPPPAASRPPPPHKGEGESPRVVAVIDIGKTNAKVALVEAATSAELALRTARNAVRDAEPYPHFDIALLWNFVVDSLAGLQRESAIDAIAIATHGAAGALLAAAPDGDGLALPVLDYEFAGPATLAAEYDRVRPDFSETLSARLPDGLNLGAQIFWQQRSFPDAFAGATYVTYPQYWAWRLCGVAASDVTSLGCHTDLWSPAAGTFSSLVDKLGWKNLIAPVQSSFDRLGPVRANIARRIALGADVPVFCGIHDSNASLLPHLMARAPPFAVVSTGTWVIVLAVGGSTENLDPRRDGLGYVDAYGKPVPGARSMGGREFELLTNGAPMEPTPAALDRVIGAKIMALPTFVPGVGPFPERAGGWSVDAGALASGERSAAASLYLALVTAECLATAGASGPIIVEGPFAANRIFCAALASLRGVSVEISGERTGTTAGAALLVTGEAIQRPPPVEIAPLTHPAFAAYAAAWRAAART